ncbi:MAG: lysophospholipid acyltransferase family protein [Thermomicrobium sp.]|nr:lysophospholipid acyltransferase family protein [Thermomicrobium sp.]
MLAAVGGWFADRIADVAFTVLRQQRDAAVANLARVAQVATVDPVAARLARGAFRRSTRNFLRLGLIRIAGSRWIPRIVVDVRAGVVPTPGTIIVSAHLGPFDVVATALSSAGYRLLALAAPMQPVWLDRLVRWVRGAPGLLLVPPGPSGIRRAIRALAAGWTVVFLVDRPVPGQGQPVEFFGVPTRIPEGPVRLARRLGCPLVPVFCYRHERGYRVAVDLPISVPRTTDAADDVRRGLEAVARALERGIRRAPDQWLVFTPVWRR